ncbi:tol-pal system YbgF family protein [Vitiosangium sp. GDMCC 1.1324]|uniref:tetratricopeptide repeat protein n=1 Tax=Vitiosangium sp. (strain GDMCC 1.1324) TaxID=2138576 RepID=UPI000D36149B|nr:tetratricopeptide repeat protein [Vitiosangium sp. GDMCC 1.1324]PTL78242.1 hypothetical protein DAT35_40010 [Vitiosangium sp. GDMCC 1.1324]
MSERIDEHDELFELLGPLDESAGPARRISRQRASELVQGALATLETSDAPRPRRWSWRKGVWVTGVCVALAGAAAAGIWPGVRRWMREPEAEPTRVVVVTVPAESTPLPAAPVAPVAPSMEVAPPVEEVPAPPEPVSRTRPAPAAEPEDLLRLANERRAEGRWQAAEALYLRVIQSYPRTTSAYVARVASGGLRLEHLGDAKGALRQFQEALRVQPRGSLSEEARGGVVEAWRALGDGAKEARALEEFLEAHPDSLLAEQARRRLRQLSSTPQ